MDANEELGYSARTRLTDDEIRSRLAQHGEVSAKGVLHSLMELLYGTEADENWGPDTLDELAQLLYNNGLTPGSKER